MSTLETLLDIPISSVYGFVNDLDRRVYLTYSNDTSRSISQKLSSNETLALDHLNGRIRLFIEPTINNTLYQKVLVEQLQYEYEKKGYTFYKRNNYVRYTVEYTVEDDTLIYVSLVSRNYSKTVIGVFDNMTKAKEFVDVVKGNAVITHVYALNDNTRKFILGLPLDRVSVNSNPMSKVKSIYNRVEKEVLDLDIIE